MSPVVLIKPSLTEKERLKKVELLFDVASHLSALSERARKLLETDAKSASAGASATWTSVGDAVFAKMLRANNTLTTVDLELGLEGVKIAEAMATNQVGS